MTTKFTEEVKAFNNMYGLAAPEIPTMPPTRAELIDKLTKFKDILLEELEEIEAIKLQIEDGLPEQVKILAEIADLLGDIQVYCASEMRKYGLDNDIVLGIIMASNMSKLGEDGKPIYDERGKVLKGPNYWRPEPQIERYISAAVRTSKI